MPNRAWLRAGLLALAVCWFPGVRPALAQEDGAPAPAEGAARRLAELEERLARQDERLRQLEAAATAPLSSEVVAEDAPLDEPLIHFDISMDEGLLISAGDLFRAKLGGRVQLDGRFFEAHDPSDSRFLIRRGRLDMSVTVWRYWSARVETEFGFNQDARLEDAFLEASFVPWLRVRAGQFKEPIDFENFMESDLYIDFAERSLPVDNLTPDRDVGIMVFGRLADGFFHYWIGVTNGQAKNVAETNDDKDVVARAVLRPFALLEGRPLGTLQIGAGATWGRDETALGGRGFVTGADTQWFTFAAGVRSDERRARFTADAQWYFGPAALKLAWYYQELDELSLGAARRELAANGWYVSVTSFLTGEEQVEGRVTPAEPFDPFEGTWGALEVGVRVARLDVERSILRAGFATGADSAVATTVGINWYPNALFRVLLDYERVEYGDDLVRGGDVDGDEDVVFLRLQAEF